MEKPMTYTSLHRFCKSIKASSASFIHFSYVTSLSCNSLPCPSKTGTTTVQSVLSRKYFVKGSTSYGPPVNPCKMRQPFMSSPSIDLVLKFNYKNLPTILYLYSYHFNNNHNLLYPPVFFWGLL